jgi:hypothetical protein
LVDGAAFMSQNNENTKDGTFSELLRDLIAAIERIQLEGADLGATAGIHAANWHRSLFQHLRPRIEGQPYLLVAVVGGTNTGKSMIFNQLAGANVSRVSHIACRTKHPICLVPRDFLRNRQPARVFPGFQVRPWKSDGDTLTEDSEHLLFIREDTEGRQPPNLLLLDTPDIDGCFKEHWDRAQLVRQAADVLVGVLTDQKYNDEAVRRFFREAGEADKPVILVFNMVDWPGKRDRCEDWLRQFRLETGIEPLHVYAAPRDERAGEELRLPFHALSPGATDPRADLADLQFEKIEIRTFRGALRQVLDNDHGLPRFLGEIQQKSEEYAQVRTWIKRATSNKIDMPSVPSHVIMDELWRWLEPHRTRFDRWVHKPYTWLGKKLLQPFRQPPEKLVEDYKKNEGDALVRGLERTIGELDRARDVGNETLRSELLELLGGVQRKEMFAEVRRRHAELPLVSNSYRQFLCAEMNQFASANKKTLAAIKAFLLGTAVLRPVITIVLLGGPAVAHELTAQAAFQAAQEAATQTALQAGHGAAAQVATHTMTHVAGEVAAGAAVAVSGDVAVAEAGKAGVRALISRIFTGFYQERAELVAAIISESLLSGRLERIERLADLQNGQAMQSARRIVMELKELGGA